MKFQIIMIGFVQMQIADIEPIEQDNIRDATLEHIDFQTIHAVIQNGLLDFNRRVGIGDHPFMLILPAVFGHYLAHHARHIALAANLNGHLMTFQGILPGIVIGFAAQHGPNSHIRSEIGRMRQIKIVADTSRCGNSRIVIILIDLVGRTINQGIGVSEFLGHVILFEM